MVLFRCLLMQILIMWLPLLPDVVAQTDAGSSNRPACALDVLLQDYAYRAFVNPRTGISYDGVVPLNLTGIKISAMRLRSGSLRSRGVKSYKEFELPTGIIVSPYVERLVLVYQNLGNWSMAYYPLPGYTYLAPVLGILAYDAANLSAINLPELDIRASGSSISVHFNDVQPPAGSVAKCVSINLNGTINFSSLISGNICSTLEQGHFSIVTESTGPSPAYSPGPSAGSPSTAPPPPRVSPLGGKKNTNNSIVWITVASVLGGFLLIALLAMLVVWTQKLKERKRVQRMEKAADAGETLNMTSVGDTKAPAATFTRTQPTLEHEYMP